MSNGPVDLSRSSLLASSFVKDDDSRIESVSPPLLFRDDDRLRSDSNACVVI